MRKLVLLAMSLVSAALVAEKCEVDGYTWRYEIVDGGCAITAGLSGKDTVSPTPTGAVAVPGYLDGLAVVSLEDALFKDCVSLTSVVIMPRLKTIGAKMFKGCTALTEVQLPSSVTSMSNEVFRGCASLASIELPSGITEIPDEAFRECTGLTAVVVPEGVTSIGAEAFRGCTGLKTVELPSTLTNIADQAFQSCSSLVELVIPNGVVRVGDKAFKECTALETVEIPESVEYLGDDVFDGCAAIVDIEVAPGNAYYEVVEDDWEGLAVWKLRGTEKWNWERKFRWLRTEGEHLMLVGQYSAMILGSGDVPAGRVTVKIGKASKKDVSKVTATIQFVGSSRKVTIRDSVEITSGKFSAKASDGRELSLFFKRGGVVRGTFDGQDVEGYYDYFSSSEKSSAKTECETVLNRLIGSYLLAYTSGGAWNGLVVSIANKGKVKISGKLASGTSVSLTSLLMVGEDSCYIPVVSTKAKVPLACCLYLSRDGSKRSVAGLGEDAVLTTIAPLSAGCKFAVDASMKNLLGGYTLCEQFLPNGVTVTPSGRKWIVAGGARAGRIRLVDGKVVNLANSDNPSGLKLTYTAKSSSFKGSFKLYALNAAGGLKSFTASVTGIVVYGCGYGTATVKGFGAIPVTISNPTETTSEE